MTYTVQFLLKRPELFLQSVVINVEVTIERVESVVDMETVVGRNVEALSVLATAINCHNSLDPGIKKIFSFVKDHEMNKYNTSRCLKGSLLGSFESPPTLCC